ncbi:TIGR02117 family protein [Fulvimarina sp. MAC8]|uniref:TIGR02117 family protein n=1 Tax=Fulvimarina sp. MAC8 TaxID=3162874 RepID=UPI0032EE106C
MKGIAALCLVIAIAIALGVLVPRGRTVEPDRLGLTRNILILSNAIHTDIALPLDDATRSAFGFVETAGLPIGRRDAEWILIGWGGEQFYVNTPTWNELKLLPVVLSIFGDQSVLRVALTGTIDPDASFVRPVALSDREYRRLLDAILESFRTEPGGRRTALDVSGYGDFDRFYPAKGRFQVLFGCNTWTGDMLRRAGLTTGWWTPLPFLLDASLDLHEPRAADEGNG